MRRAFVHGLDMAVQLNEMPAADRLPPCWPPPKGWLSHALRFGAALTGPVALTVALAVALPLAVIKSIHSLAEDILPVMMPMLMIISPFTVRVWRTTTSWTLGSYCALELLWYIRRRTELRSEGTKEPMAAPLPEDDALSTV